MNIFHNFIYLADVVQPIALASGNDNYVGRIGLASGFGLTSDGELAL